MGEEGGAGPERPAVPPSLQQNVTAVGGFAYGVVGASVHVFGDGLPLYVLEEWRPAPNTDPEFLRELPSRMLNARFAVVEFTGRQDELADLHRWCCDGPRLSARWLHGPGGQGKSRLAARFAVEAVDAGWKVITATHGPGSVLPPPGSQDLRADGAAGILLIVDYADRWPQTHLAWLLSNALLHQTGVRARVLLLARTADAWPALRASLTNQQAATSTRYLQPLEPDDGGGGRRLMFDAARRAFAARYGLDNPTAVPVPSGLDHPDFGLTLTVHMAALVAVDAHAVGSPPPEGAAAGLTAYLLDREHAHWARLFGDGTHELDPAKRTFRTAPEVMRQAVFVAALTGPLTRSAGTAVLLSLGIGPAEQVCGDHTICYPPDGVPGANTQKGAGSAVDVPVLEPLYPDRLAEDFIALTLPGHHVDYPPSLWAADAVRTLLDRDGDGAAPAWTPRAVTFLAAAAERWPHVVSGHLQPLLHEDPRLAVDGGSAALAGIARLDRLDTPLGQAIAGHFPKRRHVDLDVGMAALTARLSERLIVETQLEDESERPVLRAMLRSDTAVLHSYAGQYDLAVAAMERAVGDWEAAAATVRTGFEINLAGALNGLSNYLWRTGRTTEALAASERAVSLWRKWADFTSDKSGLPAALGNLGLWLAETGRRAEAGQAMVEAVELLRPVAETDPEQHDHRLATALHNLGTWLADEGRRADALASTAESLAIRRRLAAVHPETHEPDLADILVNHARDLAALGRRAEALAASGEAVDIQSRLARGNPAAHERGLATALSGISVDLALAGRWNEALATNEQEIAVLRRLAETNPSGFEPMLAQALDNRGQWLAEVGQPAEALAQTEAAVAIRSRLWQECPAVHERPLATALGNLGINRARAGDPAEGLEPATRAVAMLRRLAQANPPAHDAELARCLNNLCIVLAVLRRWPEALVAAEETVALWQPLVADDPATHAATSARSLYMLGLCRSLTGRPADALDPLERSVAALRPSTGTDTAAQAPHLARSLDALARVYLALGRTDEAVATAEEALYLREQLAEDALGAHGAVLEDSRRLLAGLRNVTPALRPRPSRWPWRPR
ncbi:tetratricopeptide repeat protein [Streptomyces sp. CL12-4]|uniref:tetratricopeptide repeat protein n=1 Tax=Streptomyces sp. CL12-4 TaxID=2810306 RepID=UPI001EFB85C9|nr:tetratricopeptide repeat protein [Streptomyces sp. CL12-4]MCG8971459.1 tetratricopeptide repeat protein [Streptomyces sp. CL12-4]